MPKAMVGSTRNHYQLEVEGLAAELDVLSFTGEEWLSQPFKYTIAFTSAEQDIDVAHILGKDASFYLGKSQPISQLTMINAASRTLHGVITGFKRASSSRDEARYQVTFEAHLALLGRGRQYRIYQHQSVPEIVESILRSRHQLEGQHFVFDLAREYPKREQVMQYGESDLIFISRLLAEVGIWYRFTHDDRLSIDVVEFHDHQRHYEFGIKLPLRPLSGLTSNGQDGVWALQVEHKVVEQHINVRAYHNRDAAAFLDGEVDQSRGATTTYGEGYHYGEPYTALGDAIDQDEELLSESGYFYARLNHERFLNDQTRCNGISSSVTKSSVLLLSAPQGISLTSGAHLQLAAQKNLMLNAGGEANVSVVKRLFVGVGQGLSLFVRKLGVKLIANQGPVSIQAQNDALSLIARHGLEISSTEDEIRITAKKKITLNAGGSYITIDACSIETGTEGDCLIKAASFEYLEQPAKQVVDITSMPPLSDHDPESLNTIVFSG